MVLLEVGPVYPWFLKQLYNEVKPPAPPAAVPMVCNFSPIFLFASKNLATHRSMQTLSPLLRSPSKYRWLIHFE